MTTSVPPLIPRDILIGAAKCGTTAMAEVLGQHPDVFLPPEKEVGFLSNDDYYAKGLDWYASRFVDATPGQTTLDASTQYIFRADCAQRLMDSVGPDHIRSLTAMLRHPVDRAYSSYWQSLNLGWIPMNTSFEDALKMEPELLKRPDALIAGRTVGAFVAVGLYAKQIETWQAVFGADKLKIFLNEDLRTTPRAVYEDTLSRMGLAWSDEIDLTHKSNVASLPRSETLNTLVRGRNPILKGLRRLFPRDARLKVKKLFDGANRKAIDYKPMNPETRATLLARFAPEVDKLETMLDRDLTAWRS